MSDEKSPAFRFYARDFIADTTHLTDAEAGMYLRLLCREWMDGSIPAAFDGADGPTILDCLPAGPKKERVQAWRTVSRFFTPHPSEPGRLIQKRLESERAKQFENRSRRAAAGAKGAAVRHGNAKVLPEQSHSIATTLPDESLAIDQAKPSLALASALASADTASPSGARAYTHEDPLDEDDLPEIPAGDVRTGPAMQFATWFVAAALKAGAIPKHLALKAADIAYREFPHAEPLVASYAPAELKARSKRLFARKLDATDPLRKSVSIATLSQHWDWFGEDVPAASTPRSGGKSPTTITDRIDLEAIK